MAAGMHGILGHLSLNIGIDIHHHTNKTKKIAVSEQGDIVITF